MLAWLFGYVGLSATVATVATIIGAIALSLAGRRPTMSGIVLAALTLFFIALTQLPVPDAATMSCPVPHTTPRLVPFRFLSRGVLLLSSPDTLPLRLLDKGVLSALMNLFLCVGIGSALAAGARRTVLFALGFGLTLSATVELTQLTGFWWLFPCPWRLFDIDDIILNVTGVVIGSTIYPWLRRTYRP
jgi:hypothetical protein